MRVLYDDPAPRLSAPSVRGHGHDGEWISDDGQVRLTLLPNGSYGAVRGGRREVRNGRYIVRGNWMHLTDDAGVSADGALVGDVLTISPYRFRRVQ